MNFGSRSTVAFIVVAGTVSLLPGCTTIETVTLTPSAKNTAELIFTETSSPTPLPTCGLDDTGNNPIIPPENVVWAGLARHFDAGSGPLPCEEWNNAIYRGAFRFDFGNIQAKQIVSAVLSFSVDSEFRSEGTATNATGTWVKELRLATEDWRKYPNPHITDTLFRTEPIPGLPDLPWGLDFQTSDTFPIKVDSIALFFEIEISDVVRGHLSDPSTNFGFVVIGADESVDVRNSEIRLSKLRDIELTVLYGVKK